MTKLEELKEKLKKYQERHEELLKTDKAASARYGDEFRNLQLKVLEIAIGEIEGEIALFKKKK